MTMLGVLAWSWSEIAIPGPMSGPVQQTLTDEAMCVLTGGSLIAELRARTRRQTRVEVIRSVRSLDFRWRRLRFHSTIASFIRQKTSRRFP